MSEENTPVESETTAPETATPKVRRISNKLPRKAAKKAAPKPPTEAEVPVEEFTESLVEAPENEQLPESDSSKDQPKRNRRRGGRGGKGKSSGNKDQDSTSEKEETIQLVEETADAPSQPKDERRQDRQRSEQPRPEKKRRRIDPDKVAKNAWKIYLAEVSEEGVALIGDNDARELARRCFRLASIFLEEEDRRQ